MKTISAALEAHLQQETTTVCTCWKTTLRDGAIFGFTDHVDPLTIGGLTYQASSGYSASSIDTSAGLDIDNLEVLGVLAADAFEEADVRAGRWDYAEVEIFLVNYMDLTQGTLQLRKGTLGEVTLGRTQFTAELRGVGQKLSQMAGRVITPACDTDLGSPRCGVDLGSFPDGIVTAAVTSVTSRRVFAASALGQATGWFNGGKVVWSSGANLYYPREVKTYVIGGALQLQDATPFDIQVGDTFDIYVGCDKRFTTCINKFDNAVNFQGFPHLPGLDRMISGK